MSMWRGTRETLVELSRTFMTRISPNTVTIFNFVSQLERGGTLDREAWQRAISMPITPGMPIRQLHIRTQVFCEIALAFEELDLALEGLERLDSIGFMDVTWLDHCPLMARVAERRPYTLLRKSVGDRAAHVLAAFHSVAQS
jgi:hypothetical protein